jgi:hypothetical protein
MTSQQTEGPIQGLMNRWETQNYDKTHPRSACSRQGQSYRPMVGTSTFTEKNNNPTTHLHGPLQVTASETKTSHVNQTKHDTAPLESERGPGQRTPVARPMTRRPAEILDVMLCDAAYEKQRLAFCNIYNTRLSRSPAHRLHSNLLLINLYRYAALSVVSSWQYLWPLLSLPLIKTIPCAPPVLSSLPSLPWPAPHVLSAVGGLLLHVCPTVRWD